MTTTTTTTTTTDFRSIRALYDNECITVYQAFSEEIAAAAVKEQNLAAAPSFTPSRTTWIKPSWCWMMYRSGYSYKDERQRRVLAIRIRHEDFSTILRKARLADGANKEEKKKKKKKGKEGKRREKDSGDGEGEGEGDGDGDGDVVVQWDPERSPKIERLAYRSLQIGIRSCLVPRYVEEWIESIEDVTMTARRLKERLDRDPSVSNEELVEEGLVPVERLYEVPRDIYERLEMG